MASVRQAAEPWGSHPLQETAVKSTTAFYLAAALLLGALSLVEGPVAAVAATIP